ncbi:hypothetical protein IKT18_01275 [Candidatus Saccharibacteria bacterium]|nr:hypothetical protein [Candidatus Saccharibacteria bacterium]
MKIIELKQVSKDRWGIYLKNDVRIEPHEERTAKFLIRFGFNIDVICPTNIPKVHNPDILMAGTIWEIKSPESPNKKTLKKRIHEASEQSSHIILDLRRVKGDSSRIETAVLERFKKNASLKRMILITKKGKVIDFLKK